MKITKAIASAPVIRVAPGEYHEYPEDAMFNHQSVKTVVVLLSANSVPLAGRCIRILSNSIFKLLRAWAA
jgi:hypothetical protein